jgi:hypothetical protein
MMMGNFDVYRKKDDTGLFSHTTFNTTRLKKILKYSLTYKCTRRKHGGIDY